ncbi:MAG: Asp23/Gls24 family envelope stress response protein [Acutalibacteraceae bacterium]
MEINKNSSGNIVISPEVVEKIALTAATDVTGIAGAVSRPQDIKTILKSRQVLKPVICVVKDGQFIIDIYLKVNEGVKLTEVATKVQKNIKEAVQNMTNTVVNKINVHICEVELKKTEEK